MGVIGEGMPVAGDAEAVGDAPGVVGADALGDQAEAVGAMGVGGGGR